MEEAITRRNHTGAGELISRQEVELRLGDRLSEDLLGDAKLRHTLQSLDSLHSTLTGRHGRASHLNGEETSVTVGQVLSNNLGARGIGRSLGENAEARSPLDARLAAKQSAQDSDVGFVGGEVGAGEGDNHSIGTGQRSSLLTTIVLRWLGEERQRAVGGRSLDIPEERLDPLAQAGLAGAVGDNRDVRLGIDTLSERGDRVLVQVWSQRCRVGWVNGGTETFVEGDCVSVIQSLGQGTLGGLLLLQLQDMLDLLVEFVG